MEGIGRPRFRLPANDNPRARAVSPAVRRRIIIVGLVSLSLLLVIFIALASFRK